MSKLLLLLISIALLSLNILAAQPKIVFNTDQSKNILVRPGDTMRLEITIGNYGNEPIDENYEILANFNPTEAFLSSSRYVLDGTQLSGIPLEINEQKQFTFEYLIPEDAPEVSQTLIFSAQNNQQSLHTRGGFLFLRINIESRAPLPDLLVRNFRFPRLLDIYRALPIYFEVTNTGELLSFESTHASIYLSTNGIVDENSIFLKRYEIPPLVVGDQVSIEDTFDLEKIPPAVYRLIVVVDEENTVQENDEVNNVFSFNFYFPVNGNAFPDLFFSLVDFPFEIKIGDPSANQKIRTLIWNQTRPRNITPINISVPICNQLYLSKNTRLDENDRLLGTASLPNGIGGNQTAELIFTPNECFEDQNNTTLFPNDLEAGNYYLIFVLDANNEVIEYFENNVLVRRVKLSNPSDNFSVRRVPISFTKVSLYPNPTSERLVVQYESTEQDKSTLFALHDTQGRLIFSGKWENFSGQNQRELDLSLLEQGIYFLKVGNTIKRISVLHK